MQGLYIYIYITLTDQIHAVGQSTEAVFTSTKYANIVFFI